MKIPVLLLSLLLIWQADGRNNLNQRENTFKFGYFPPPPEVSPPPPVVESPPSSPPPSSADLPIPPDYLPKPRPEPSPDDLPSWVKGLRSNNFHYREYQRNLAFIAAFDDREEQADVLVYGDSVTALSKPTTLKTGIKGSREPWENNFGDLKAEPLGIPADRIGNLMWRLAVGKETPKIFNPKVIVIFIGVNDLRDRTPPEEVKERMEYVIQWMLRNMPDSKIVLQALLPSLSKVDETNATFEKLATDYNIVYSNCGTDIKKADRSTYMADRLHPNVNGQNLWLKCLRNVVQPLLDES